MRLRNHSQRSILVAKRTVVALLLAGLCSGFTSTWVSASELVSGDDLVLIQEGDGDSPLIDINAASISVDSEPCVYDGTEKSPSVSLFYSGNELIEGEDYAIRYEDNIDVGDATILVTGMGDFTGEAKASFLISPKSVIVTAESCAKTYGDDDPALSASIDGVLNGDAIEYALSREEGENVGTYAVWATGDELQGNYKISYSAGTLRIDAKELKEDAVLAPKDETFSGFPLIPEPTVKDGDVVLREGVDYEVRYVDNTNVGTATVYITGVFNYKGSFSRTFQIKPSDIARATVSLPADQAYTGSAITPAPTVTYNGLTLVRDTDYKVTYENNVNLGTAKVTITGVGNFTGTCTGSFQIKKLTLVDVFSTTAHAEDIYWLAERGITLGWGSGASREFRPYANVARADMAAFLFRLAKGWGYANEDWQPNGTVSFVDVTENTPHYREIMWLAENGISMGWPDGTFRPYANVARSDMAAFLHRMAQHAWGKNVDDGQWFAPDGYFADVSEKVAHSEDIMWLAGTGISKGWGSGSARTFRPLASVARADMAAFLHRLNDPGQWVPIPPEDYPPEDDPYVDPDDPYVDPDDPYVEPTEEYVIVTRTGTKYHRESGCRSTSGKVTYRMTLEEAIAEGYTPCKNCYH